MSTQFFTTFLLIISTKSRARRNTNNHHETRTELRISISWLYVYFLLVDFLDLRLIAVPAFLVCSFPPNLSASVTYNSMTKPMSSECFFAFHRELELIRFCEVSDLRCSLDVSVDHLSVSARWKNTCRQLPDVQVRKYFPADHALFVRNQVSRVEPHHPESLQKSNWSCKGLMMDLVEGVGSGKERKRAVQLDMVWVEWSGWCRGDGLGQVAKQLWRSAP